VKVLNASEIPVPFDEDFGICSGCNAQVAEGRALPEGLPIPDYYAHSVLDCLRAIQTEAERRFEVLAKFAGFCVIEGCDVDGHDHRAR